MNLQSYRVITTSHKHHNITQKKIYAHELHHLFPARNRAINEAIKSKFINLCNEYCVDMNRLTEKDLVFVYSQQDIESNILARMKKKHKEGLYKKVGDFKKWWNGMFSCVIA